jgi:hypothetical protein
VEGARWGVSGLLRLVLRTQLRSERAGAVPVL